jgi:hypothetical protein
MFSLFVTFRYIILKFYCRYPFENNPEGLPERTNETAGEYAKACIAVATEFHIPFIDLWTKMQTFPDWKKVYLRFINFLPSLFIFLCNIFES